MSIIKQIKNAIVTGAGRNSGIGAEICRAFARNGINVYFTSNERYDNTVGIFAQDNYEKTLNECLSAGTKAFFRCFDLINYVEIKELFKDAIEKLGEIDILVNCACFHVFDKLETLDENSLDASLNVNAKVTLLLCKEFYMQSAGGGSIICLSSTQDLEALTQEVSYAVSKATVSTIVSTLAPTMAKKKICINAVNPGATEIGDKTEKNMDAYLKDNAFGRLGLPPDAANLICFLISDQGKWITGQTINSEGGLFRGVR